MPAAALLLHDARFVLHAQDDAEDVGVERRGVGLGGLVDDRADPTFGARIVHRYIEASEPLDGLVDERADVVLMAYIGVDELGFRTVRAQLLGECLAGPRRGGLPRPRSRPSWRRQPRPLVRCR